MPLGYWHAHSDRDWQDDCGMYDDEPDGDADWEFDDEWVEAEMNCGRMRDGQCSQAGAEYCDLSCPFRELLK